MAVLQQSDSLGLVVISEEDTHRTLLIHRIVFDDIYFRQGGEAPPWSVRKGLSTGECLLTLLPLSSPDYALCMQMTPSSHGLILR